jgi:hypothetical protein
MNTATKKSISFVLKELTPLPMDRPPRYADILLLQKELNSCTASIDNDESEFGYSYVSMTDADYLQLADGIPFVVPVNPGHTPDIPVDADALVRADIIHLHNIEKVQFVEYRAVESALKRLLCKATNPDWFTSLEHETYQLAKVTCKQMITHLWTRFGLNDESDLDENRKQLEVPWDAALPIDTLFARMNRCKTFAEAGGEVLGDSQLTYAGLLLIEKTGLFTEACRLWRMKPQATRTYALFQTYFYAAHRELTKTTASAGYHSANAVKDAAYEKLAAEFAAYKSEVNKKNAKSVPNTPPKPKLATDKKDMTYCWTHGFMSNTKHTSATCKSRGTGHVDESTGDNQMGGCATIWQPKTKKE